MRLIGLLLNLALLFLGAHAAQNTSFNPILKPAPYDTVFAGQYTPITWTPTTRDPISLLLYYWGTSRTWILADNIANTGQFQWFVSPDIAYPTLVDTPYAGDPDWFEIHIYNGSFRQVMGAQADGFVGIADQQMEMNRGAMWFNITAPRYSVEVVKTVMAGGITSMSSGGITVTNAVTWTTGAVPTPGIKDNGAGGNGVPTSMVMGGSVTGSRIGNAPSSRVPSFASVKSSAGISNWRNQWTAGILMAVVALIGVIFL